MKILIVSYIDDNFGDILIRVCFEKILKVVLNNLHLNDYAINKMSLKDIDENLIRTSDIIFFAGGGLFGLSYLNFFEYLDAITKIAENNNIPVVFSSIGINNMDATVETEEQLKNLLKRKCIKAISVRENLEMFKQYSENCIFEIKEACDPAVWSKYIYSRYLNSTKNNKKIIGINIVRGGLFNDNKKEWKIKDEMEYLNNLKELLENSPYDYRFYTNGSVLDNNTMRYFAKNYNIPDEKLIFVNSTKELIETIDIFDFVVAIRMHSTIISYSLEIPSINLIWNDKIPLFYKNINYQDRAIELNEWNSNKVYEMITNILKSKNYKHDKKYLMSLYIYLYETLSSILKIDSNNKIYTFNEVKNSLENENIDIEEDISDYKYKIKKAEKLYLDRFIDIKKKNKEIKKLEKELLDKENNYQKEIEDKNKKINEQAKKIDLLENKLSKKSKEITEKNKELEIKVKQIKNQKQELDRINNKLIIKIYRKTRKYIKKIIRK